MTTHKRKRQKKDVSKNSPPIQFKCTQEEYEQVRLAAEKHMPGLKVAAFVRGIVLTFIRNEKLRNG